MFQSTPVIANGRISAQNESTTRSCRFQSTPVIANGRIPIAGRNWPIQRNGFNPRPLLLTGESDVILAKYLYQSVSIHARYC